jgi:plasmid replication initiation protein
MNSPRGKEDVIRRIVVEYGQLYAYVYMTDGNGKLIDEEAFKQPFRLDRKDVFEEAKDAYDNMYDWLNDVINVTPLQEDDDEEAESDEED